MAKIGRNERCPCRSGKKYKHCCAQNELAIKPQLSPEEALKVTLMSGVKEIQADAVSKQEVCRELGVFFFYSTTKGDGWLLEMTECDCVQVARDGEILAPPIEENSETIEVNWSHMYAMLDKKIEITAYEDKSVTILEDAPSREINAAMRRIRKKFSSEQLGKVHVSQDGQVDKP